MTYRDAFLGAAKPGRAIPNRVFTCEPFSITITVRGTLAQDNVFMPERSTDVYLRVAPVVSPCYANAEEIRKQTSSAILYLLPLTIRTDLPTKIPTLRSHTLPLSRILSTSNPTTLHSLHDLLPYPLILHILHILEPLR